MLPPTRWCCGIRGPSASTSTQPTNACTVTVATRSSAGARNHELTEVHRRQQADYDRPHAGRRALSRRDRDVPARAANAFRSRCARSRSSTRGEPHVLAMIRDLTERRPRRDRSRAARGAAAPGAEDGGDRAARRAASRTTSTTCSRRSWATSLLASQRESTAGDRRLAGYLAQAQRSCERARDLIQQMLMFSRGHRGSPRRSPWPRWCTGALAHAASGLAGHARARP